MNTSILRPLAFSLLYLTIVSCSTDESVPSPQPGRARAAATGLAIECDVNQGYRFNASQHATYGYITALRIGQNGEKPIPPDIKVMAPNIFNNRVVSVLTNANWSMLPTDNIVFKGRISVANAQQLKLLTLQSPKRVAVALSFVVYQFDNVSKVYFTQFKSYKGTVPLGEVPLGVKDVGMGNEPTYALLGKSNGTEFGLKVGAKPEKDPAGIQNYTLELTLAPTIASSPQQILLQTSPTAKFILPWGIPHA